MLSKLILNLQFFADGGGEGDGGDSGEAIPSSVPERAKEMYKDALKKNRPVKSEADNSTDTSTKKMTYAELIASDDYKADHQAYMEKTIGDRLKKYKETDSLNEKMRASLESVAMKYGIDSSSESFLDDLQKAIEGDDSYYEEYAYENDITPQEARRVVTLERKVKAQEEAKRKAMEEEQRNAQIKDLYMKSEQTKKLYPDFDLNTELQDERFRRLCAVNGNDTTAAYRVCHWDEISNQMIANAVSKTKEATVESVKANKNRPAESGLNASNPSSIVEDFSKLSLEQIREQARKWRNA